MLKDLQYRLKTVLRARDMILWGLLLPVFFLFVFSMAFRSGKIEEETLPTTHIVVVGEKAFKEFLGEVGAVSTTWDGKNWSAEPPKKDSLPIALIEAEDEAAACQILDQGGAETYVTDAEKGMYETRKPRSTSTLVVQELLKSFQTTQKINANETLHAAIGEARERRGNTKENAAGFSMLTLDPEKREGTLDWMVNFQFSTIAYVTFYSFSIGGQILIDINANEGGLGVRAQVSPQSRRRQLLTVVLCYFLIYLVFSLVLYTLTRLFGMEATRGISPIAVLLLIVLGNFAGLLLGTFVGSLLPDHRGVRQGLGIAVPLILAFISGLMSSDVHRIVMEKAPFLHLYNPLGAVSNGLYALKTQGIGPLFQSSVWTLLLWVLVFFVLSALALRRDQYAHL